uniref:Uncharacterized protein n=1 Tax=Arundo donax TaxID=35708 RepID=A0A0A9C5E4_ARUDO
MCCWYCTG